MPADSGDDTALMYASWGELAYLPKYFPEANSSPSIRDWFVVLRRIPGGSMIDNADLPFLSPFPIDPVMTVSPTHYRRNSLILSACRHLLEALCSVSSPGG